MTSKKIPKIECSKCTKQVCFSANYLDGPENCPTRVWSDVIHDTMERYHDPELAEFARLASVVEGSAYRRLPWSESPAPGTTRLEEIIRFALKMGYKKLGVAFCIGLSNEAEVLIPLLENCGFEVESGACVLKTLPPSW